MEITISLMRPRDLPEVMELERESFTWPWSEEFFLDELSRDFSYIFLAKGPGGLVGFICFWVLVDEMHILNVAVRKNYRRKGIAGTLAMEAMKFAKAHGARSATLEVREKNTAAIKLYEKMGFVRAGLRRNYYDSPRDNAVIMWLYDIKETVEKSP
jgi:ribosomal-protein-alanine N-acetyltransferase